MTFDVRVPVADLPGLTAKLADLEPTAATGSG
jgi:hypothetical protein